MTIENSRQSASQTSGRSSLALLALGVAVMALTGCQAHNRTYTQSIPLTSVEDRHPILQPGEFAILDLPVIAGKGQLSARQRIDLEVYFHGYQKNGGGPLFIATPQGTANEATAIQKLGEIRQIAARVGVHQDVMVFDPYTPHEGEYGFPISLKYQTARLVKPQCGNFSDDLSQNHRNEPYSNFGCSRQRNLASMIANPADLRHPTRVDPRYGPRRDVTIEKYADGEVTESGNNQQEPKSLAQVGQ